MTELGTGALALSLDRIDTGGLRLKLPGTESQNVSITSTENLKGTVTFEGGRTTLSHGSAAVVTLAAVRVLLGELLISSANGARLDALVLSLDSSDRSFELDVAAAALVAADLDVEVNDVVVRGRPRLEGVKLVVRGSEGSLSAKRVELGPFVLRVSDVELFAEDVRGEEVKIAWGPGQFQLTAASLEAPSLKVVTTDLEIAARSVEVNALEVVGGDVRLGRIVAAEGRIVVTTTQGPRSQASSASDRVEPLFDPRVLDSLFGRLDVDVAVDLTVPIIGRRKATHRLRIAIDHGTVDYRALEKNLARLEDALLDFSVREGALVLERVNPLLPTRGHGKPVVVWHLAEPDLELARNDRVRLAVLPMARLTDESSESRAAPPAKSPIALRHLSLLNINAKLALAPTEVGGQLRLRRVGAFALQGNVSYDPAEPAPPGAVLGEVGALAATIHGLRIGKSALDVASAELRAVAPFEIAFADVTPTAIQLDVVGLTLEGVALLSSR